MSGFDKQNCSTELIILILINLWNLFYLLRMGLSMVTDVSSGAAVCTTQEAARILGISVTSVQQLVEAGIVEAWKTRGGHRRIPLAAVLAYKSAPPVDASRPVAERAPDKTAPERAAPSRPTAILVIEDSPMQREVYRRQIESWTLPVELTFCENGYQALIEIASHRPDVLLADIVMDGIDGYEVVRTIQAHRGLGDMNIAILSGLTVADLDSRGGVPAGVVFFNKPVNYDELRGYLRACCAQKERERLVPPN
jgi:excisionase family DNA binding protein